MNSTSLYDAYVNTESHMELEYILADPQSDEHKNETIRVNIKAKPGKSCEDLSDRDSFQLVVLSGFPKWSRWKRRCASVLIGC